MKTTHCRYCDQLLPEALLKLPDCPLANEFPSKPEPQETFPLQLTSCHNCHLYQLNYSVDADRLFNKDYVFVSGTSSANRAYFRKYAEDTISRFSLKPGDFIIEIASNDGSLLKVFQEYGMRVLGIDPASKIAEKASEEGVETIADFFSKELAEGIKLEYGQAKIIIANNVLAHLDNVNDVVKGVKLLLGKGGVFIFENSYFRSMYENMCWDILYHEHKSYPLIVSSQFLFAQNEMCLFDVEATEPHGGSIRGFVSNEKRTSETVDDFIRAERELGLITNGVKSIKMAGWQKKIERMGAELREKLEGFKKDGKIVDVFGFPAKITTLFYALGLDRSLLRYGYDHATLKIGTFSPGYHIPILSPSKLIDNKPDVIFVGAWNFADHIIANYPDFRGNWLIPMPTIKELGLVKLEGRRAIGLREIKR